MGRTRRNTEDCFPGKLETIYHIPKKAESEKKGCGFKLLSWTPTAQSGRRGGDRWEQTVRPSAVLFFRSLARHAAGRKVDPLRGGDDRLEKRRGN